MFNHPVRNGKPQKQTASQTAEQKWFVYIPSKKYTLMYLYFMFKLYIYIYCTYKNLKEAKFPKIGGMTPESLLLERLRPMSLLNFPNSLGMLPVMLFWYTLL